MIEKYFTDVIVISRDEFRRFVLKMKEEKAVWTVLRPTVYLMSVPREGVEA